MLKKAHLVKLGKTSPWRNKTVFNALHVIKTESVYQPLGSRGPGEAAEEAFGRTGWGCPVLHTAGSSLFCLQFCLVSNFPALILSFLAFVPPVFPQSHCGVVLSKQLGGCLAPGPSQPTAVPLSSAGEVSTKCMRNS